MKKLLAKIKSKKKGFTLVELIVVIAIIAILAAILVPTLTKYIGKTKQTAVEANAKSIYTAASAAATDVIVDGYTLIGTTASPVTVGSFDASLAVGGSTGDIYSIQEYMDTVPDISGADDKLEVTLNGDGVVSVYLKDGGKECTYPA